MRGFAWGASAPSAEAERLGVVVSGPRSEAAANEAGKLLADALGRQSGRRKAEKRWISADAWVLAAALGGADPKVWCEWLSEVGVVARIKAAPQEKRPRRIGPREAELERCSLARWLFPCPPQSLGWDWAAAKGAKPAEALRWVVEAGLATRSSARASAVGALAEWAERTSGSRADAEAWSSEVVALLSALAPRTEMEESLGAVLLACHSRPDLEALAELGAEKARRHPKAAKAVLSTLCCPERSMASGEKSRMAPSLLTRSLAIRSILAAGIKPEADAAGDFCECVRRECSRGASGGRPIDAEILESARTALAGLLEQGSEPPRSCCKEVFSAVLPWRELKDLLGDSEGFGSGASGSTGRL